MDAVQSTSSVSDMETNGLNDRMNELRTESQTSLTSIKSVISDSTIVNVPNGTPSFDVNLFKEFIEFQKFKSTNTAKATSGKRYRDDDNHGKQINFGAKHGRYIIDTAHEPQYRLARNNRAKAEKFAIMSSALKKYTIFDGHLIPRQFQVRKFGIHTLEEKGCRHFRLNNEDGVKHNTRYRKSRPAFFGKFFSKINLYTLIPIHFHVEFTNMIYHILKSPHQQICRKKTILFLRTRPNEVNSTLRNTTKTTRRYNRNIHHFLYFQEMQTVYFTL